MNPRELPRGARIYLRRWWIMRALARDAWASDEARVALVGMWLLEIRRIPSRLRWLWCERVRGHLWGPPNKALPLRWSQCERCGWSSSQPWRHKTARTLPEQQASGLERP